MERIVETLDVDLIDLGAVSAETKGAIPGPSEADGRLFVGGISED
jgi:hypothetical protein